MLPNKQGNAHTVTVRYTYISVTVVANSSSRRLICKDSDRYIRAVVGVPMTYDLSVLGKERTTAALRMQQMATDGVQFWVLRSSVKATFRVSEVTIL